MLRKSFLFALGASTLFMLANRASAQAVPEDLRKQFEELLAQPRPRQALPADTLRWGGVNLAKVSPEVQTKLGLPEKEGLVVAAVDANSVGEKAGLKKDDVLLKINKKAVPSDADAFVTMVNGLPATEPMDLVVVRNGKEETLKGTRMPAVVQNGFNGGRGGFGGRGGRGIGGIGGIGGAGGIGGIGGIGGAGGFGGIGGGRIQIMPAFPNPFQQAAIQNMHVEINVNGAKIVRDQKGDQFSGNYTKGDLKISVAGKIANGLNQVSDITVQQGKETSKYKSLRDVPAQHRATVQQLLPSPLQNMMLLPFPNFDDFPGLPVIPGFDK